MPIVKMINERDIKIIIPIITYNNLTYAHSKFLEDYKSNKADFETEIRFYYDYNNEMVNHTLDQIKDPISLDKYLNIVVTLRFNGNKIDVDYSRDDFYHALSVQSVKLVSEQFLKRIKKLLGMKISYVKGEV